MAGRHTIKLPEFGESVSNADLVEWHIAEGDDVEAGAPLLTVETDKVDTEVPAPIAGRVVELLASVGAELEPGSPVCVIEG